MKTIVKAIIKHKNKILVLKDAHNDSYSLPGVVSSLQGKELLKALEAALPPNLSITQWQFENLQTSNRDQANLLTVSAVSDIEVQEEGHQWLNLSDLQQIEALEDNSKEVLKIEHKVKDNGYTEVFMFADGGSRGNPGPASSGYVVMNTNKEIIFEGGEYLGVATNNCAEYNAVLLGLSKCKEIGATIVHVRIDSLLAANQLNGVYKIKSTDLMPYYQKINELLKEFQKVDIQHVRREFNKEADAVVNKILDNHK